MRDPALKPTNVVFMGMGEPLLNWDAVDATLTILNRAEGLGIGARHITLSTVGILPNLAKFANRPEQFRLAVALENVPKACQGISVLAVIVDLAVHHRQERPVLVVSGLVGRVDEPERDPPQGEAGLGEVERTLVEVTEPVGGTVPRQGFAVDLQRVAARVVGPDPDVMVARNQTDGIRFRDKAR